MKDNVHIESEKHDPEDIVCIAELTYTEMVEDGFLGIHIRIFKTLDLL